MRSWIKTSLASWLSAFRERCARQHLRPLPVFLDLVRDSPGVCWW